jgi:predicted benzoate:H+ symporter BenE
MPGDRTGFAVGWGSLALINAALAQAHRRSGLRWFIVSLLIGPFATLLLTLWYRAPVRGAE